MTRLLLLVVLGAALAGAVLVLHGRARDGLRAERWRLEAEDRAAREGQARALAAAVTAELDELLAREARRPWDAWRPLVLPPDLVAKSVALVPSPLSGPPPEPLVAAYFELRDGQLTGPGDPAGLRAAAPLAAALAARLAAGEDGPADRTRVDPLAAAVNCDPRPTLEGLSGSGAANDARLAAEWDAYQQRKGPPRQAPGGRATGAAADRSAAGLVAGPDGAVALAVHPWRWVSAADGADGWPAAVAAARRVELGGRAWLQGLVLDVARLRRERVPALATRVAPREVEDPAAARKLDLTTSGLDGLDPRLRGARPAPPRVVTPDLEVVAAAAAPADAPRLLAPLAGLAVVHRGPPLDAERLVAPGRALLDGALALAAGVVLAGLGLLALTGREEARLARQRADFVAALTHELKAPLTGFRALTELLHDGLVTDEAKKREYYASMLAEAERLSRLVQNVLDAARLERGALEVVPARLDPAPLVRDVAERFRARLESEGFRLEVDVPDDLPPVLADREAVGHVLGNLLDNAAKYGRGAERLVRVEARPRPGGGVAVAVSDRGPGVPPGERGRVFERFWRSPSVPRQVGGAGLGLTIARAHARAVRGELLCDDAPGGGARFTLTLEGA